MTYRSFVETTRIFIHDSWWTLNCWCSRQPDNQKMQPTLYHSVNDSKCSFIFMSLKYLELEYDLKKEQRMLFWKKDLLIFWGQYQVHGILKKWSFYILGIVPSPRTQSNRSCYLYRLDAMLVKFKNLFRNIVCWNWKEPTLMADSLKAIFSSSTNFFRWWSLWPSQWVAVSGLWPTENHEMSLDC